MLDTYMYETPLHVGHIYTGEPYINMWREHMWRMYKSCIMQEIREGCGRLAGDTRGVWQISSVSVVLSRFFFNS